jgi:hypothetical protein
MRAHERSVVRLCREVAHEESGVGRDRRLCVEVELNSSSPPQTITPFPLPTLFPISLLHRPMQQQHYRDQSSDGEEDDRKRPKMEKKEQGSSSSAPGGGPQARKPSGPPVKAGQYTNSILSRLRDCLAVVTGGWEGLWG